MPTIHREAGFSFAFFANDHPPAHVHVTNGDGAMKVNLGDGKLGPTILSIHSMKDSDARAAFLIVLANKTAFLAKWRKWHG